MQAQQQVQPSLNSVSRGAQLLYILVAWLFVLCIIIQVFLAGLSVFMGASWWATHVETGHLFGIFTIVLLLLAFIGRFNRSIPILSAILLVQYSLQYIFIEFSGTIGAPALAALHPVNAVIMFWVAVTAVRQAQRLRAR